MPSYYVNSVSRSGINEHAYILLDKHGFELVQCYFLSDLFCFEIGNECTGLVAERQVG